MSQSATHRYQFATKKLGLSSPVLRFLRFQARRREPSPEADGETPPATDQPLPEGIPWFLDLISLYSWGSQGRPGWEAGNLLPWGSCLRG